MHANIEFIFRCQDKLNYLPGATDALEDLAAKCVNNRALSRVNGLSSFSDEDIITAIHYYYNQCREICERKLARGKQIAQKFVNSPEWGGLKMPDELFV